MARYAFSFDLDTTAMKDDGFSPSQVTSVYQIEAPNALESLGFTKHPQGSLYYTESDAGEPLAALLEVKSTLQERAPNFCRYLRNAQVFRMDDWSDATKALRLPRLTKATVSNF